MLLSLIEWERFMTRYPPIEVRLMIVCSNIANAVKGLDILPCSFH